MQAPAERGIGKEGERKKIQDARRAGQEFMENGGVTNLTSRFLRQL